MFKKPKSKVLIDYASEEEDVSWNHRRTFKYKDPDGKEEIARPESKQIKVKKAKSKSEKGNKKLVFPDEDEHTLLTGDASEWGKGSNRKNRDGERNKTYIEKGQCLWDSFTMSMKQMAPTKKADKVEGWEPPHIGEVTETADGVNTSDCLEPDNSFSWTGVEEDSSRYANLLESQSPGIRWTTRAKGRLAVMRRRGRGGVSEKWEGLK